MLVNVQLLRFVAALLVVFYHCTDHLRASGHELGLFFTVSRQTGFAGVDIFFVISGFIMAWTTEGERGWRDAMSFIKRRIARIYSGYWPFFLIAFGLFTLIGGHYLANAKLLQSALLWPTELQHLLIPVSWTLIFEMFFYVLFAAIVAIVGTRKMIATLVLLGLVLAWSLYSQFVRHAYDPGLLETMNVYEQYFAFPFLIEFLTGALLAGLFMQSSWSTAPATDRKPAIGWIILVTGIALWLTAGWINESQFGGKLIQGYYVVSRVALFGSASLLIVGGLVYLELTGTKFLTRFSLLTGGASYALYLSHTLILAATQKAGLNGWAALQPAAMAQVVFIILAILMVIYSVMHYQWIERPLHRLFKRLLRV